MNPLLTSLTDEQVVALTLYGEARSEGPEGRIAVANVLRNRMLCNRTAFGLTLRDVCLKPNQFSCWLPEGGSLNYGLLMDTALLVSRGDKPGPMLRECSWIAAGLFTGSFVDNTHGSSHYVTSALYHSAPPSWAVNQRVLATIGAHVFFRVA